MDEILDTIEGQRELLKISKQKENVQFDEAKIKEFTTFLTNSVGCTSNVVLLQDKHIICANAGDSRAVLSHGKIAVNMSLDHKPNSKNERTRILKAGSIIRDGRVNGTLNVSRTIGDLKHKQVEELKAEEQSVTAMPEIRKKKITHDTDFMIIGCDGVWEKFDSQEMVDYMNKALDKNPDLKLSQIIENLFDTLLSPDIVQTGGLGCDNMTCMIIKFKKEKFL